ncbi:MAG: DUF72 domain-containing protein [Sphingomonas sp.]|nr:DUF72 domain-containing protein [Sphingomonas sp.]
MTIHIGTAGWTIPRNVADQFPTEGSSLERYAARFNAAEINSSFYRSHRASTWERWRDSVPAGFRFSVKLPKTITHEAKLADCEALLDAFVAEVEVLGDKLGALLVQLPPKLDYDETATDRFFTALRARASTPVACEPRNASWFSPEADDHLRRLRVARVAADPARFEGADRPGGWRGFAYLRLHGSPVMYRSSYADRIGHYAALLSEHQDAWCIFDNTASSAATADALALASAVRSLPSPARG